MFFSATEKAIAWPFFSAAVSTICRFFSATAVSFVALNAAHSGQQFRCRSATRKLPAMNAQSAAFALIRREPSLAGDQNADASVFAYSRAEFSAVRRSPIRLSTTQCSRSTPDTVIFPHLPVNPRIAQRSWILTRPPARLVGSRNNWRQTRHQ